MKRKLYHLLVPTYIKEKLYQMNADQYQLELAAQRKKIEQGLTPVELSPIYIRNLKVVTNLYELVKMMKKNATVAEVGVGRAEVSEIILMINQPARLFLFDDFGKSLEQDGGIEVICNKFKEEIQSGVVELCDGDPVTELSKIPEGSLDWVLLRSDNSYHNTASLLELACGKVKTHGVISGCNYTVGHWMSMQRYGVIEAVNSFCKKHGWEMIYLTNESNRQLSYSLKKISLENK